jgi:hypothetical protein
MARRSREVNAYSWNHNSRRVRVEIAERAPESCVHQYSPDVRGGPRRRNMRQALLVSVAALALAAGSTLALSQGGGQGGGGQGGAGMSGGASGGAQPMEQAPGKQQKGAQERPAPTQKSTQQEPGQKSTQQERQEPGQKSTQQERKEPGAQQRQQTQSPSQQRQTESPQQGGAKQGAQTGDSKGQSKSGMASSNVSLTSEQKTTIRNTVISSGPRISSVNFAVRVGVVVPRSVRIAPVPATLIEIQPAWRGYSYFIYEDEIIIVEPRTLKIIAVVAV